MKSKSYWRTVGLVWILVECSLVAGNIFGFSSLFGILPKYGIYGSKCESSATQTENGHSNDTVKSCTLQMHQYQFAFTMGIGFYNVPAMAVGIVNDYFGPRCLKFIAIICHLISWLSLGFVAPNRDGLLILHTIFLSLAGVCTLISSMSFANYFTKRRGLVVSLVGGAQITGCVWFAVFQILIQNNLISLSTLAFIWASFALLMLGSSLLFLDWRFPCLHSILKSKSKKQEVATSSKDSLIQHVKDPLFIIVTLFLSFLLLTISFLPVVWYRWLIRLTNNNIPLTDKYTLCYNMVSISGIVVSPIYGCIIDFKAYRGHTQKMLNISILQTFTWISYVVLCIVCMCNSLVAAQVALFILIFSRPMLISGCQALIAIVFPPQFIGSLLGIMWTVVGIISFGTYGLVRLSMTNDSESLWKGWAIILFLCFVMSCHLVQVWILYIKSKKRDKTAGSSALSEDEMKTLKSPNDS